MTLAHALKIATVALLFGDVERATGHPDGKRETDTTHTVMLVLLAATWAEALGLDVGAAVAAAAVHDLPESLGGDTSTAFILTPEEAGAKASREAAATRGLAALLGEDSWTMRTLASYNAQATPEARLVRYLDKVTPRLTHVLDDGRALRRIGHTAASMREKHRRQQATLAAEYPEFADTIGAFLAEASHAAETVLEESE